MKKAILKTVQRLLALALCVAMLLPLFPTLAFAAAALDPTAADGKEKSTASTEAIAAASTDEAAFADEIDPWDYAPAPSEISDTKVFKTATAGLDMQAVTLPAYPGGTISNVKVLDCGYSTQNGGYDGNEYKSYLRIVTGTGQAEFDTYRQSLKNAGYIEVSYHETQNGVNSGNKNCFAKFIAGDGSHSVYFYRIDHYGNYDASDTSNPTNHPHYNEARIVVDTNPDTVRAFTYTAQPGGSGTTELYMYGLTMSDDGWDMFNEPTSVSQQRRNCGQLIIMKMPDNSLFINDGGGTEQFNDEKTCQAFLTFCREITGVPEGQKMVINTWFITHAHRDHYSGLPTFLAKCGGAFELKNILYNFESNYGSNFHTGTHPWIRQVARLYPDAKYYNLHTGEKLNIAGVELEVLFTTEDRLRYADGGVVSGSMNDTSAVLMMRFDGKKFLLTGDLGALDTRLLSMYPASYLKADILQVPHHGFDGNHATLCATVSPAITFFTQNENAVNSRLAGNYNSIKASLGKVYFGGSQTVGITVNNAALTEIRNEPVVLASEPYPDGIYIIKSALDQSKEIAIEADAVGNGTRVHLWTAAENSTTHMFILRRQSDSTYTLQSLHTGDFIDVGTDGYLWMYSGFSYNDGQYNRHWKLKRNLDGTVTFVSASTGSYAGKVMDVQGAVTANGTTIQPYDSNDTNAQKWVLAPQLLLPAGDYVCNTTLDGSNSYMLNADGSNACISNTLSERHWAVTLSGDGYYYIRDVITGKYLSVDSTGNVVLDGALPEKWSVIQNKDDRTSAGRAGTWGFVSCSTNKYLDVVNAQLADKQNVQVYQGNLTNAQMWNIRSVAHTHIQGNTIETVAPTCTAQGYTVYACPVCGETFQANFFVPNGHTIVTDAAVAPTCTENGLTEGQHCSVCGELLATQQTIAALGHSYGYTDNGDGTHTATCANCGDTFTEDHTFTDGTCVCGAIESTEPTLDNAISIGQQLSLESDLSLTFRIKESQLTNYDFSTAYLVVERDIYPTGGEMYVKTDMLTEYTIENSRLAFVYSGIAAAQMNDEICVTLHIKDSTGKEYVSNTLTTSVTAYAKLLLDAYGTTQASLCTVLMDMLNYGTAAQIYFDRHTDAPANTAYAEFADYASYASADFVTPLEDLSSVFTNEGATATMNLSVELATQVGIIYKVTLPEGVNAADATVVVKDEDGNELETLSLADGTVDSKGRYVVTYFGTPSRLMRRVVYGTVYVGGAAISNTYGYSISTYAYQIANTAGMPEALVNLTNLMTMYGDAANAYFGG